MVISRYGIAVAVIVVVTQQKWQGLTQGVNCVIPRQTWPAAVSAPLLSLRVGRAKLQLQIEDWTLLQRRRRLQIPPGYMASHSWIVAAARTTNPTRS